MVALEDVDAGAVAMWATVLCATGMALVLEIRASTKTITEAVSVMDKIVMTTRERLVSAEGVEDKLIGERE